VHRFSEKAKRQMLDAMQGRKSPKQAKDPRPSTRPRSTGSKDGTPGFPVIAFKAATVGGARFYGKRHDDRAQAVHVLPGRGRRRRPKLARIDGEPQMREDVVRVGRGGTDLRYRPEFREWRSPSSS
jgi:hypothetical protein